MSQENRTDRRIYGAVSSSVSAWTREYVKPLQVIIKTRLTQTLHISLKLLGKMHILETIFRHFFHSNLTKQGVLYTETVTALFQMQEMLIWQLNLLKPLLSHFLGCIRIKLECPAETIKSRVYKCKICNYPGLFWN